MTLQRRAENKYWRRTELVEMTHRRRRGVRKVREKRE